MSPDTVIPALRDRAQELAPRAHVPFSDHPVAAVLLMDDGTWLPGVRVESASYSLTMPALLNGYTTAVAAGRAQEVIAIVLSRPIRREEEVYLEALPHRSYEPWSNDAWIDVDPTGDGALPSIESLLPPGLDTAVEGPAAGIDEARRIARRAYVPESDYPVGAVLERGDGGLVPGVNVEHPDWGRILCAERNALGTLKSYALPVPDHLYLTCNDDPKGTPCGACRQLLAELAPDTTLWMDRRDEPPERTTVSTLLPGSFRGHALLDGP